MARFEVSAELTTVDGSEGTLEFSVAEGDLKYRYIPAVTREEAVVDEVTGEAVRDDEGCPKTTTVEVTPGRQTTDEEAIREFIAENIFVDFEKKGVSKVRAEVQYTITGYVEFDAEDWDMLDQFEDYDPDQLDEYTVRGIIEDQVYDAIRDDVRNGDFSDLDWDIRSVDAE